MAQNLSSKTVSRINIFVFKRMVSFNTKYTFQRVMTQNMETHLQCYVSLYACWSICSDPLIQPSRDFLFER